jgi:chemotaxis protein MotB
MRYHRRQRKTHEPSNHDRWLVSYADFITLLFAFFTTLYAISNVDAQKLGRMVMAMKAAFDQELPGRGDKGAVPASVGGNAISPAGSIRPALVPEVKNGPVPEKKLLPMPEVKRQIEKVIEEEDLAKKVKLSLDRRGMIIRMGELNFFDSGSSNLKPEAKTILDKIAAVLLPNDYSIRVEGHTDNVPISTSKYPSNWELSTARATSMVLYLITTHGFDPQKLSASGYGEFRPIAPNDTPENRAQNRRVDLVVLNEEARFQEPANEALKTLEEISPRH